MRFLSLKPSSFLFFSLLFKARAYFYIIAFFFFFLLRKTEAGVAAGCKVAAGAKVFQFSALH